MKRFDNTGVGAGIKGVGLLAALALLLAGCHAGHREAPVTIATLKGPSSIGMIRLIDSLAHAGDGSVRVEILNEPMQVRKRMIDGTAGFAILPSTMAALLYNKGLDYRLVAVPVWGTLYLVGSDTTLTRWEQLRGRRVYMMARGMTPDLLFRSLLLKKGIDPDRDLLLDYSFPTHIDLAHAAQAGKAGLAVLSEPLATLAMKNNPRLVRIFSLDEAWQQQEGIAVAETAFLGRGSLLHSRRALAEQLIAGYAASTRWVNQYPDSAAALVVRYGILPDSVAALRSIPRLNLNFVRAAEASAEINRYFEVFHTLNPGLTGGKMPDEDFIYR